MSAPDHESFLDATGVAAPPRDNGELRFEAPWESRVFGVALALHRDGAFGWEDFRRRLIDAIRRWEEAPEPRPPWSYYRCWMEALEAVLAEIDPGAGAEVDVLARQIADRPHGHDHPPRAS